MEWLTAAWCARSGREPSLARPGAPGSAPKAAPPPAPKAQCAASISPRRRLRGARRNSARALAADGLRRGLFQDPKLGREHAHPRHRHRAHRPPSSAVEHLARARALVQPWQVHCVLADRLAHVASSPGCARAASSMISQLGAGERHRMRRALHCAAEVCQIEPGRIARALATAGLVGSPHGVQASRFL